MTRNTFKQQKSGEEIKNWVLFSSGLGSILSKKERKDSQMLPAPPQVIYSVSLMRVDALTGLEAMGIKSHNNDENVNPITPSIAGRACQITCNRRIVFVYTLAQSFIGCDEQCSLKQLNE